MLDGMSTKIVDKMTPAQCRAARGLLEITQSQLAHAAKLGLSMVVDFEKERRQVSVEAVEAIRAALERAGLYSSTKTGAGKALDVEGLGFQGENRRAEFLHPQAEWGG